MTLKFDAKHIADALERGQMTKSKVENTPGLSTNLTKKLIRVMSKVSRVKKSGRNTFQNYDYVTEADILEEVRSSLIEENIFVFQSLAHHYKQEDLTTTLVNYTFVDGDSGEERTVTSIGQGHDKQDKGVYKALTGASKYFLMKNFLMPTGDDPENDGASKSTVSSNGSSSKFKRAPKAVVNVTTAETTVESSSDDWQ